MTFEMPDLTVALPEIWLASMAFAIMVVDLFSTDKLRRPTFWLTQLALLGAAGITIATQWGGSTIGFSGTYIADSLGVLLKVASLGMVVLAFAYSRAYLEQRDLLIGEFYVLGLFGALGMMVMISAHSLLTLYLGLELMSLCLYALVAMNRSSTFSTEAAMKYFVLGALASGILLYGMSMLYGMSGSINLADIAAAASAADGSRMLLLGMTFVLVGVAFKFGAVPFHMWVPDVYQGAPTVITQYIATASKVAAVGLFLRLLGYGLEALLEQWQTMMIVLAVLSIAIGNVVAIAQSNIKRMLAYSTFNHIGFIFLGLLTGSAEGYSSAVFYAIVYGLTSAAAFGTIMLLSRKGFEADLLEDFKGLSARSGLFALVVLVLMISLTGIPGTAGFYAKWMVLKALVEAGMVWLAVFAVIFTVVGAFYYLRVVKLAYFDAPDDGTPAIEGGAGFRTVLAMNGAAILLLGLFPGSLIDAARVAFGL